MGNYYKRWNVPVPAHLDEQLKKFIEKDLYKTKSEFIRVAVRDRLEQENKKLETQP
jgi:Arc/MetJ-type ribon-helix-helix transcriptional regulator